MCESPKRLRSNGTTYWCKKLHLKTPTEQIRAYLALCRNKLQEQMWLSKDLKDKYDYKRIWKTLTLVKAKKLWSYLNLYYFCSLVLINLLLFQQSSTTSSKARQLTLSKCLDSLIGIILHNLPPPSAMLSLRRTLEHKSKIILSGTALPVD